MNTHTLNKIIILFAHPALQKSRVNRQLIRYVMETEGVTFHDLYEAYPDFHIKVNHEQDLLLRHDIIVLHHPMFWFSTPALIKEWLDLVLEHGWAYGKGGRALKGKKLLSVITTGGREAFFRKNGYNRHTINEFLAPMRQTAFVCGMDYLPPFVVHGTHTITPDETARHGKDYRRVIVSLRDGTLNLEAVRAFERINENIDSIIMEHRT